MTEIQEEDDLFRHSSMSFGEHLEELRGALMKAVIALVIGFSIGLIFGFQAVRWIQVPLETALAKNQKQQAIKYLDKYMPPELRGNKALHDMVLEHGYVPEEVLVDPRDMFAQLKARHPELADVNVPALERPQPPPAANAQNSNAEQQVAPPVLSITPDGMMRQLHWHRLADDERLKLESFKVEEGFVVYLKAAFLVGAIISSPFVFYFMWSFVAAGLYPHEKKYIHVFLPFSVGLFLLGAAMATVVVFPPVLEFFFDLANRMNQEMRPRISDWLSFVLLLPLGFGVAFQMPLVMLFLERIGVFSVDIYKAKWRISVLTLAVISMVLTPGGSPVAMLWMLGPLIALYFLGLGLCIWMPSPREKARQAKRQRELASVE